MASARPPPPPDPRIGAMRTCRLKKDGKAGGGVGRGAGGEERTRTVECQRAVDVPVRGGFLLIEAARIRTAHRGGTTVQTSKHALIGLVLHTQKENNQMRSNTPPKGGRRRGTARTCTTETCDAEARRDGRGRRTMRAS